MFALQFSFVCLFWWFFFVRFNFGSHSGRCLGGDTKYFSCNTQVISIRPNLFAFCFTHSRLLVYIQRNPGLSRVWWRLSNPTMCTLQSDTIWRCSLWMGAVYESTEPMRTELYATWRTILLPSQSQGDRWHDMQWRNERCVRQWSMSSKCENGSRWKRIELDSTHSLILACRMRFNARFTSARG